MFGLITIKKLNNILKESFKAVKQDNEKRDSNTLNLIDKNKENITNNSLEIAKLKGIIETLKVQEVREVSPRTPRTKKRVKFDKMGDKAEIFEEIKDLLNKDYSTSEIYNQVVEVNQLCKKTCFYKYLKVVRETIIRTTRTKSANKTKI
jgi:hypothetical protein|tara:strand:+ start:392 stop:838 length:447 start_codon:yes stop_codon:yes gene_type:complete